MQWNDSINIFLEKIVIYVSTSISNLLCSVALYWERAKLTLKNSGTQRKNEFAIEKMNLPKKKLT